MSIASLVLIPTQPILVNQNLCRSGACRGWVPNQARPALQCLSVLFLASVNWRRNHLWLVYFVVAGRSLVGLLCPVAPIRRAISANEGLFVANIRLRAVEGCERRKRLTQPAMIQPPLTKPTSNLISPLLSHVARISPNPPHNPLRFITTSTFRQLLSAFLSTLLSLAFLLLFCDLYSSFLDPCCRNLLVGRC